MFLNTPSSVLIPRYFPRGLISKGVKMIPPGTHFIYYSSSNRESNDFSPIVGFFVDVSLSEVIVKKCGPKEEQFSNFRRREPIGGEITIISESEMVEMFLRQPWRKSWLSTEQLKSSKFPKPDKKSPSKGCYYTSIPRDIKLKGASGQDLPNMNLDKTQILETILTKQYGGSEDSLLGELQFAFIAFLPLHSRTRLFTKLRGGKPGPME